jgi:hypothetical protein
VKKPLLVIGALVLAGLGACYFGPEHQRFLAFSADRECNRIGSFKRDGAASGESDCVVGCQRDADTLA